MEQPEMQDPFEVAASTFVLPQYLPVPGMGVLAVNSYLINGSQPVLVDTGIAALSDQLVANLCELVDPTELAWIWLTHTDPDHIGALSKLIALAPQARIVTTYLGMGKLGLMRPVAPERVYLLNPGQGLDVGDRVLKALKPPTFDAPETTALFDSSTRALFSSDCFGALLQQPRRLAADIDEQELRQGVLTWAGVDAPWIHGVAAQVLEAELGRLRVLDPSSVLGSHLPPATGMTATLLDYLKAAREAPPFVGPDQRALLEMLHAA